MNREIITIGQDASMTLLKILEVEPICKFCGCKITKENFGVYLTNQSLLCAIIYAVCIVFMMK